MKTAIFVDGAFFLKRFKNLYEGEKDYKNAEVVANELCSLCYKHLLMKDKGKVMKNLMPRVKGKADGKLVNQLVGAKLS